MTRREGGVPRKRLSMRKVNEVLRLFHISGVSKNEIAGAVDFARSIVQNYTNAPVMQASRQPLPEGMS
jgi:hypothetical protein